MRLLPLAFAVVVLVAAGCTSRSEPATDETDPPAETTTTATTTATTTTTTTSEPPAPAPENAADGTDYTACTDGTCEVFIAGEVAIPLAPEFGFTSLRVVQSVGAITLFDGGPVAQFGVGGKFGSGDLTIELLSVDIDGAIVAFSTG